VVGDVSEEQDLVQALGLALAMVGALLEREQPIPRGEFSRLLAVLAEVTRESEDRQGAILSDWAALAARANVVIRN
jgi:hypothetical protein